MSIKRFLQDEKSLREVAKVAFDSVDTDYSGEIDEEGFQKAMKQVLSNMGANPISREDFKEIFEHLDTDHSGQIDFNEFTILIKDVLTGLIEED